MRWQVQADEEALPFGDGSLDLVLSNLSLHWINDVPGTLIQVSPPTRERDNRLRALGQQVTSLSLHPLMISDPARNPS